MPEHDGPGRDVLERIDALQIAYIAALDRRDMAGWRACFDEAEGAYACLTEEGLQQDLPLAMMLDDNPARLADRVRFVEEVWAGTFEPYATRHFVQRLACAARADGVIEVTSNLLVTYTSARRHSEILVAGRYEDEVVLAGGAARFRRKRAILDTVTLPRYLVYPV